MPQESFLLVPRVIHHAASLCFSFLLKWRDERLAFLRKKPLWLQPKPLCSHVHHAFYQLSVLTQCEGLKVKKPKLNHWKEDEPSVLTLPHSETCNPEGDGVRQPSKIIMKERHFHPCGLSLHRAHMVFLITNFSRNIKKFESMASIWEQSRRKLGHVCCFPPPQTQLHPFLLTVLIAVKGTEELELPEQFQHP